VGIEDFIFSSRIQFVCQLIRSFLTAKF